MTYSPFGTSGRYYSIHQTQQTPRKVENESCERGMCRVCAERYAPVSKIYRSIEMDRYARSKQIHRTIYSMRPDQQGEAGDYFQQ